jgi:hypothetical protein
MKLLLLMAVGRPSRFAQMLDTKVQRPFPK